MRKFNINPFLHIIKKLPIILLKPCGLTTEYCMFGYIPTLYIKRLNFINKKNPLRKVHLKIPLNAAYSNIKLS